MFIEKSNDFLSKFLSILFGLDRKSHYLIDSLSKIVGNMRILDKKSPGVSYERE